MLAAERSTSADAPVKGAAKLPAPVIAAMLSMFNAISKPTEDAVDQAPCREDTEIDCIPPRQHPKPHARHQRQNQWTSHIENRSE